MINITITGIRENQRRINAFGNIDIFRKPMTESLALLHDGMARYPAQPSGSKYRRTGLLGRSWTSGITTSAGGIVGTLGNNARDKRGRGYGPYVQDDELQSARNRHWQTDVEVMRDNETEIRQRFDRALQSAVDGQD